MLLCSSIAGYYREYLELFRAPRNGNQDTLREFINAVNRLTGTGPQSIRFRTDDDRNKFKGDSLEILAEIFFNQTPADPRFGLREYTPIDLTEDYGVDATGINANGHKTMVQVKFRNNRTDPRGFPTYGEIARTFASGVIREGLDPTKDHTLFVFTTANDVTPQCHTVFAQKLVVIHYAVIQEAIDNNRSFWTRAYELVQEYVGHHRSSYSI